MKIIEAKVVIELTLEERDTFCEYVLREMDSSSMSHEVYDLLGGIAREMAPGWC